MNKPKLALYWAASCGGCEVAVLDVEEKILDVAAFFDLVFWPCAMDFKYKDVEAMPDGGIDLCLFNGAIRTSENESMARLLRRKAKILAAFGSCACDGCIPGLANLTDKQSIFRRVYEESPSTANDAGARPQTHVSRFRRGIWRSLSSSRQYALWGRWFRWITTCPAARRSRRRSSTVLSRDHGPGQAAAPAGAVLERRRKDLLR
jgi:Ni,Fe-hydrogenase III small subunit